MNKVEYFTDLVKSLEKDERRMNDDTISRLSEIRSEYNCFDEDEEPYYRALSKAIRILSRHTDNDTISRQEAIYALDGEFNIIGRENAETIRDYINSVDKKLRELPSAERRGRWIHRPVEEWGASNCKCSICGAEYFFPLLLKGGADNYCGNCGARMVEEVNPCDTCEIAKYTNLEDDDSICRDCGVGE